MRRCRVLVVRCRMQDTGYKEEQISSFGKAFLSKKRFLVVICVICGYKIGNENNRRF